MNEWFLRIHDDAKDALKSKKEREEKEKAREEKRTSELKKIVDSIWNNMVSIDINYKNRVDRNPGDNTGWGEVITYYEEINGFIKELRNWDNDNENSKFTDLIFPVYNRWDGDRVKGFIGVVSDWEYLCGWSKNARIFDEKTGRDSKNWNEFKVNSGDVIVLFSELKNYVYSLRRAVNDALSPNKRREK